MYLSKIVLLFSLALLASCGKSTPPAPNETVESLAANPERLKELRQQCKTDRAKLGDEPRISASSAMARCLTPHPKSRLSFDRLRSATNQRFFSSYAVLRLCAWRFPLVLLTLKRFFLRHLRPDNGL
jgi:hypothetical protein